MEQRSFRWGLCMLGIVTAACLPAFPSWAGDRTGECNAVQGDAEITYADANSLIITKDKEEEYCHFDVQLSTEGSLRILHDSVKLFFESPPSIRVRAEDGKVGSVVAAVLSESVSRAARSGIVNDQKFKHTIEALTDELTECAIFSFEKFGEVQAVGDVLTCQVQKTEEGAQFVVVAEVSPLSVTLRLPLDSEAAK